MYTFFSKFLITVCHEIIKLLYGRGHAHTRSLTGKGLVGGYTLYLSMSTRLKQMCSIATRQSGDPVVFQYKSGANIVFSTTSSPG